ncbi:hypothetical protein KKA15_03085 [Patescibacteria group bacterium]|nr:hypothetical protein [Patescibacteria group bacterium]
MTIQSKFIKTILCSLLILVCLNIPLHYIAATDSIGQRMADESQKAAKAAKFDDTPDFTTSALGLINILLGFLGVFFIILIIYGGYLWMDARGREEQIDKGKKILIAAFIGIVIIISARIISEYLLIEIFNKAAQKIS